MSTTTEKPVKIECPPDGYYWVRVWTKPEEGDWRLWEDWSLIEVHNGRVYWMCSEEVDNWNSDWLVFTELKEIKPPTEETV